MSKSKRQSDYLISIVEGEVCKISEDFTLKSINSNSRKPNASHARFMVWYILHKKYHMNFTYIGKLYNKHYSSIGYGISRVIGLGLVKQIPRKLLGTKKCR